MLDNLLTNAAVHTPAGTPVRVEVTVSPDAARVHVADQGPGIPPDDRDSVFDRFYRVDKARSRDRGGSGLGLSVARSLVQAHGGSTETEPHGEDHGLLGDAATVTGARRRRPPGGEAGRDLAGRSGTGRGGTGPGRLPASATAASLRRNPAKPNAA